MGRRRGRWRRQDAPVIEVMRSDIPNIDHRRNLDEALRQMQEKRLPAVDINDRAGRLIGLVMPENLGEMMMIQPARPQRGAGAPGGLGRGSQPTERPPDPGTNLIRRRSKTRRVLRQALGVAVVAGEHQ